MTCNVFYVKVSFTYTIHQLYFCLIVTKLDVCFNYLPKSWIINVLTRAVLNTLIFKLLVMRILYQLPWTCWYLNFLFVFIILTLVFLEFYKLCFSCNKFYYQSSNIIFHVDLLDSSIPPDVFTYVVLVCSAPVHEYIPYRCCMLCRCTHIWQQASYWRWFNCCLFFLSFYIF